jgi:SlyX protein
MSTPESRIEDLEMRIMHLEAALDELTRSLLAQEQRGSHQADRIRQLETRLQELREGITPPVERDPPPPHY